MSRHYFLKCFLFVFLLPPTRSQYSNMVFNCFRIFSCSVTKKIIVFVSTYLLPASELLHCSLWCYLHSCWLPSSNAKHFFPGKLAVIDQFKLVICQPAVWGYVCSRRLPAEWSAFYCVQRESRLFQYKDLLSFLLLMPSWLIVLLRNYWVINYSLC